MTMWAQNVILVYFVCVGYTYVATLSPSLHLPTNVTKDLFGWHVLMTEILWSSVSDQHDSHKDYVSNMQFLHQYVHYFVSECTPKPHQLFYMNKDIKMEGVCGGSAVRVKALPLLCEWSITTKFHQGINLKFWELQLHYKDSVTCKYNETNSVSIWDGENGNAYKSNLLGQYCGAHPHHSIVRNV